MFLVYKKYKEFQRAVKDSPFRSGVTDHVTCSWKLTWPQPGSSDVKIFTALVVDREMRSLYAVPKSGKLVIDRNNLWISAQRKQTVISASLRCYDYWLNIMVSSDDDFRSALSFWVDKRCNCSLPAYWTTIDNIDILYRTKILKRRQWQKYSSIITFTKLTQFRPRDSNDSRCSFSKCTSLNVS